MSRSRRAAHIVDESRPALFGQKLRRVTGAEGARSVPALILRAAVAVGIGTVLVRIVTLGREFLIARQYGIGNDVDAFVVAFLVPTFLIAVLTDSLNQVLVPALSRASAEDEAAGRRLVGNVLAASLAGLSAVCVAVGVAAPALVSLVAPGFDEDTRLLAARLLRLMLPIVGLGALASVWSAVLTSRERFAVASLAPMCVPLFAMLAIALAGGEIGVYAIAVGTLIGYVIQLVPLIGAVRGAGVLTRPSWRDRDRQLALVLKQYAPLAAVASVNGLALFVDQAVATMLGQGQVGLLYYGNRLVALVISVVGLAIGTAVLPYFSRQVAERDWPGLARAIRTWSAGSFLVTAAGAALLILASEGIVSLLFQGGAFDPGAAEQVTAIQRAYLLQLPFFGLTVIAARALSALNGNHIILWGALINLVLNVTLVIILAELFGVVGIALARSALFPMSAAFLLLMLRRRFRAAARPGPQASAA
jgi:putative peptidoglycan lipid II flippase